MLSLRRFITSTVTIRIRCGCTIRGRNRHLVGDLPQPLTPIPYVGRRGFDESQRHVARNAMQPPMPWIQVDHAPLYQFLRLLAALSLGFVLAWLCLHPSGGGQNCLDNVSRGQPAVLRDQ
jgi:hypothetical protein